MKSSGGPYGGDSGSSLPRYATQHGSATTVPTTSPLIGHSAYLNPQHQSMPTIHSTFASLGQQSAGSSPRSSRDFHPHHLHSAELQSGLSHRGHVSNPHSIGLPPGHAPMHITQRRRTSGQRPSLLWDIAAGERERDRTDAAVPQMLPHSYAGPVSGSSSHGIPGANLYTGRPNISMMSSMGGLHSAPKLLISGALPSQSPSATPPRYNPSPASQTSRQTSASLHQFQGPSTSFIVPTHSTVKQELGALVKEEAGISKSPLQQHYPQAMHSQAFISHQPQHSAKNDIHDKEMENMPSKDTLLQSMDKVDKEINKVANEIKGLERKKHELEHAAKEPPQAEKSTSPKKVETKHRDLWQVIYAENKKKAESARGMLDHLCQRYDMPLYNQPCDTKVYQDNLKKNEEMRPKLLAYFQRRSHLSNIREQYLSTRYDQLMEVWQNKTEKIENNVKRKAKDAKVREFFEKQFPEIRKVREQQERFTVAGTRSGTRGDTCRSDADFNEIVDGLSEQEHHEQHMRQLAVVPPMLLDRDERRIKFINNNGLVTDPLEDYKKRQNLEHWNAQEKQIFKEKYIQHPKNFNIIASFLEKKTVADCVLFYYLSKKSVGYKSLVRKNSLKPKKVKSGRGQAQQASSTSSAGDLIKAGQQSSDKNLLDKFSDQKRESPETTVKEEEIERIDRPPSPRVTRSRNKNMNWTDEDISVAKEGFAKHGKDFAAISRMFSNKAEHQIKNFYNNYKKKHNLDQLISDSKKKKTNEGSRRTRTQVQPTESVATTSEETQIVEEGRPESTDSQISNPENSEPNKKRKKDTESEKMEEEKLNDLKKTEVPASIASTAASEVVSSAPTTTRVTTPVGNLSTLQVRTRRSAAVTTPEIGRGESAKRAPDSPVDEPAEKKAKKSKTKELKTEKKETTVLKEEIKPETELTQKPSEKVEQAGEKKDVETTFTEQPKKTSPSELAPVPILLPPISISTTSSVTEIVSSIPSSLPIAESYSVSTKDVTKPLHDSTKPQPSTLRPLPSHVKSSKENDGDSSATCSADEEPNMQDVETSRSVVRKHADSPYAFEEDSSAPIKLESKRSPILMYPTSTKIKTELLPTQTSEVSSVKLESKRTSMHSTVSSPIVVSKSSNVERPSSTHPPPLQTIPIAADNKRPQSQPPPPLAGMAHTSVPISALSFQPTQMIKQPQTGSSRPNSTPGIPPNPVIPQKSMTGAPQTNKFQSSHFPGGHIVGQVPHPSEFFTALQQNTRLIQPHGVLMTPAPRKLVKPSSDTNQTIDLTISTSESTSENESRIKSPVGSTVPNMRRPHYHPVSHEATSLNKDFTGQKVYTRGNEDVPSSRPHIYTATDIASMHDRAAVLPPPVPERPAAIPVSSLRAPMTSDSQSRDASRSDHGAIRETPGIIKLKESQHSKLEHNKPMLIQPGLYQPAISQVHPMGRPSLTTSSIPTKFVSGSITTGAPVLQKQRTKPPEVQETRKSDVLPPQGQLKQFGDLAHGVRHFEGKGFHDMYRSPGNKLNPDDISERVLKRDAPMIKDFISTPQPSKMTPVPTAKPVDGRQELKGEVRTNIIPGREILVQPATRAPVSHEAWSSEATRQEALRNIPAALRYQPHMHPSPVAAFAKAAQNQVSAGAGTPGSILAGTPVKRKPSEDSNSSLSPAASYPGVAVSRPSPILVPPSVKQMDRKLPYGAGRLPIEAMMHPAYHQHFAGELAKKEEIFHGHRRTPDKNLEREQSSRSSGVTSPSHRRTPTGMLSQHPAVKQETPGSPHSAEELLHRNALGGMISLNPHLAAAAAAANPGLLRMPLAGGLTTLPFNIGQTNPEILNILCQYSRGVPGGTAPSTLPLSLYQLPGVIPGFAPSFMHPGVPQVPTVAPGSPQSDDGRETERKKMLKNDFLTAQLMRMKRPSAVTAGSLGIPMATPSIATPGLQPLVVTTPYPYSLAAPYHSVPAGGHPVDRLNFIPRITQSPYGPFSAQLGRTSVEGSRSPIPKPSKTASPEPVRQRQGSGEIPREFTNHPAIKERNSPISPIGYHSPRGNTSPRDRFTPQGSVYQQQQWPPKSYNPHPHSSTPPNQSSLPYQVSKSPHHPQMHHPSSDSGHPSGRPPDARSSPYSSKHSRSGSLDATAISRLEKNRPDSAGPHPRSLPQSPNVSESSRSSQDYPHVRRESHSPNYRQDVKRVVQPSPIATHDTAKMVPKSEERVPSHRGSPRPMQKLPPERSEARLPQPPFLVGGSYPSDSSAQQRQKSRPVATQQKEVQGPPPFLKDASHSHAERSAPRGHENIEHVTSKNPGEDLKRSGRAKIKAAMFIDHIINLNFSSAKPSHSKQPSEPVASRVQEKPQSPRPTNSLKQDSQARYEMEGKRSSPFPLHYPQSQQRASSPGGSQLDKMKQHQMATPARGMTFGEHSADVINECYRTKTGDPPKITPNVAAPSPHSSRSNSGSMVTEPISPPDRHTSSKPETVPPIAYQQYHKQIPRYPGPTTSAIQANPQRASNESRNTSAMQQRPPVPQQTPIVTSNLQHQQATQLPTPSSSSLEYIIKKALLNPEGTAADEQGIRDQPVTLNFNANDMIFRHAMMSTARPASQIQSKPAPQPRKEPASTTQQPPPQSKIESGSEKYVSALMFREMSGSQQQQNAPPGNIQSTDRAQQFYQPGVSRTNHPVSSPAPPAEPAVQQRHQEPIKYESLSDSD